MVRGPVFWRCVLLLAAVSGWLDGAGAPANFAAQRITPAAAGPFRVEGNRLLDSRGRAFVIRGVELPPFRPGATAGGPYTPFSGTTLSGVRRRWNFNAVRIALDAADFQTSSAAWSELTRVVHSANELELLVIMASPSQSEEFWKQCAARFRHLPNLLFAAPAGMAVALRGDGIRQPILIGGETADGNIIRDMRPPADALFGAELRSQAGQAAEAAPVIASGWDLPVNTAGPACDAIPRDPTAAEAMVQANLEFFDAHGISSIAPPFAPGILLGDYWSEDATSLEYGWTCSPPHSAPVPGIGEMVRFRLWGGSVRRLFVVNGGGGMLIPRGSIAIGYGPILASRDSPVRSLPLPLKLGGVSVKVADRLGVTRRAKLEYASAGWGQVNFIVPPETAAGPAQIAVVRDDGSSSVAAATIVDFEPSLWSAYGMGFGPAIAFIGTGSEHPAFHCTRTECRAKPIPLGEASGAIVRLHGTGFRFAGANADIRMRIGGIAARVLSIGASNEPGNDDIVIELPPAARGLGETDVICQVNGRLANVVRINIGVAHN